MVETAKAERIEKRAVRRTQRHPLRPTRQIRVLHRNHAEELATEAITVAAVGEKAWGLACLPSAWTPPFFVLSACCFDSTKDPSTDDRLFAELIREALLEIGAAHGARVMVRSSSVAETMDARGAMESIECASEEVVQALAQLVERLARLVSPSVRVHWIVQLRTQPRELGHLSNERRLREEPRDWVVEFEQKPIDSKTAVFEPLSVRPWRDGQPAPPNRLGCDAATQIPTVLKHAAQWGMQFESRLHFEWVWDGQTIDIVQVDAEVPGSGTDPHELLPTTFTANTHAVPPPFRRAGKDEYERLKKLSNAALYSRLGYEMPAFYVLDDATTITGIVNGTIAPDLEVALGALTAHPLLIRVDGSDIPANKREMLPRSDELRSMEAAREWLLEDFSKKVVANGLTDANLVLVAHHFIPSTSSAWARAEPNSRWVRVESLWGVPEGLYWYSHDTFEIDTLAPQAKDLEEIDERTFGIRQRLRYKGRFFAPNPDGTWITHNTKPPFDWRRSVRRAAWLREIAITTRRIAESEGDAVAVMWFVDVLPEASGHAVLPWFHSKSDAALEARAAPRRKRSSNRDFTVHQAADLNELESLPPDRTIERVTVEPLESDLIRNLDFAQRIATEALKRNFVVELAGGILSHIYYVLSREGCRVECLDLFGADEERATFNKIVRDEIPELIQRGGERAEVVRLTGDALAAGLSRKLVEESLEALDAEQGAPLVGELADVIEVVHAICKHAGIDFADVERARERKSAKRGSFDRGLMLLQTSMPHTVSSKHLQLNETPPYANVDIKREERATSQMPSASRMEVKPDLRSVGDALEKLVTFATDIASLGERTGATTFSIPFGAPSSNVTLEISLRRIGSEIRGRVSLRSLPVQSSFDFQAGGDELDKPPAN